MRKATTPRSYFKETPRGVVRCYRFHLRKGYQRTYLLTAEEIPDKEPVPKELHVVKSQMNAPPNDGQYCTRSDKVVKPARPAKVHRQPGLAEAPPPLKAACGGNQ
ncbi:hypothetical protein LAZ67_20001763 [Cordylochernes scorpioides]|uniref:Uncharacterized protein n=1 Tax=Cordylochernes scorpioides TaxID=51811 RepID=A0ABY6LPJ0_9ARAC|nr:hypothetical protein LAZ67_20001763 [Cordylochernes scorpioides]